MPKRKAAETGDLNSPLPRRSARRKPAVKDDPASTPTVEDAKGTVKLNSQKEALEVTSRAGARGTAKTSARSAKSQTAASKAKVNDDAISSSRKKTTVPDSATKGPSGGDSGQAQQFWLMKAEPETRFENGIDVRFSIDDLAACTEPEPWDGIRNYVARNNMRDMRQGDLAFFYHSNCKEPGIVGIMEIVKEHSPDWSALDPKTAYYDAKSKDGEEPRWSVVHVEFRRKFKGIIGLKELKELGKSGGPLEQMQMLKQSRLSVSKVSKGEWEFLVRMADAMET